MAEQVIQCTSACTVTVVHEFNLPLLNMSLDEASALAVAITLVFSAAWGVRALLRLNNSPDVLERSSHED